MKTLLAQMHSNSASSLSTPFAIHRSEKDPMSNSTAQFRTPAAYPHSQNKTAQAASIHHSSAFLSQPKVVSTSPRRDSKGIDGDSKVNREEKQSHSLHSSQNIPPHSNHHLEVTPFPIYNHSSSMPHMMTMYDDGHHSSTSNILFYNNHFSGLEVTKSI